MKKEILKIGFKPLSLVNKFIKKNEKLIFFYSNLGFRDNVRAFYEYLIAQKYNEEYQIVVSINDVADYKEQAPKNVTFVNNRQGIPYFLRAKYGFYCFGKYPIKPSGQQTIVNLWHGTPLKKIGNLEKGLEKTKKADSEKKAFACGSITCYAFHGHRYDRACCGRREETCRSV